MISSLSSMLPDAWKGEAMCCQEHSCVWDLTRLNGSLQTWVAWLWEIRSYEMVMNWNNWNVHSHFIHNSPKLERTQMPIHLQNKLLVYNRDGCQKHSGEGTTIVTAGRSVVAKLVMGGKESTEEHKRSFAGWWNVLILVVVITWLYKMAKAHQFEH